MSNPIAIFTKASFIITRDIIDNGQAADDDVTPEGEKAYPFPFRLYDDDGNLYYEGRARNEGGALIAAFDWGMSYAGTTNLTDEHGVSVIS